MVRVEETSQASSSFAYVSEALYYPYIDSIVTFIYLINSMVQSMVYGKRRQAKHLYKCT